MRAMVVGVSVLAAFGSVLLPATADAAPRANVEVTIIADGTDLSGVVTSSRPRVCAADRTVVVFKVRGTPGGGDDQRFAMDTTDRQGGRYVWSTGTTGTEGRFYAKLKATPDCRAAISGVVRARR
ncbi:hypothetical protein [Nocardioides aquiterrae]|uniref:hypothetical protein n=1 Tax=Nocardioides aquiterrae TaxID=203799 RepID=UPI0031E13604